MDSLSKNSLLLLMVLCLTGAGITAYLTMPILAARLDWRLVAARWTKIIRSKKPSGLDRLNSWLPLSWQQKISKRLQRAGYFSKNSLAIYLIMNLLPAPLFFLVGLLIGSSGNLPLWGGIVLISLVNSHISRRIILRQKAFAKALFKIYRFLDLQMTAGIKVTDSLRGLPEAVCDPLVRPALIRFAALYELTLNLDLALEEIRLPFSGTDFELFSTHLRQCLQTGEAGKSLARMEELLFSRYFNLMQIDTRRIRTHLLLTAILGIAPGLILFLYPFFFTAMQAMQTVFG